MKRREILQAVEPYISRSLEKQDVFDVSATKPIELLNRKRLDIIPKYVYAHCSHSKWSESLYKEHLRILNGFREKNNNKNKYADFKTSFDETIESLKVNRYLPQQSLIPVDETLTPVNGSHRVGASIALDIEVNTIVVDLCAPTFDYNFFRSQGLLPCYLDYMALTYARLKEEFFVAIVFPIVREKLGEIRKILKAHGVLFYEKEVFLNRNGIHNLVLQMYKDMDWLNSNENRGYSKTYRHSFNRHCADKAVSIFFIEGTNVEKMVEAKAKIRSMFNLGNYPIHISDDKEESLRLAEQLLNENSIHFLNNASLKNCPTFRENLQNYSVWLGKTQEDKDSFCIDGSSVLAAYGLRDARDLDFISLQDKNSPITDVNIHNKEFNDHIGGHVEYILDPRHHFFFDGLKYLTLVNLKKLKSRRKEKKDTHDLRLISHVLEHVSVIKRFKSGLGYSLYVGGGFILHIIRKRTPRFIYPYVQLVYRKLKAVL